MDLNLTDRVVVVTGAANGIGLATARAFAAEGAHVAVWDVRGRQGVGPVTRPLRELCDSFCRACG